MITHDRITETLDRTTVERDERAQDRDIEGRASMSTAELIAALRH